MAKKHVSKSMTKSGEPRVEIQGLLKGLERLFRHFDVKPFTLQDRNHVDVEARWSDDDNLDTLEVERRFVLSWDDGHDGVRKLFMELQRWLNVSDDSWGQTIGRRIALTHAREGGWDKNFVNYLQRLALQLIAQAANVTNDDVELELVGQAVEPNVGAEPSRRPSIAADDTRDAAAKRPAD